MFKKLAIPLGALTLAVVLTGCGDGKMDNKQPQLQGPPDPKIKGPAPVGAQPGAPAKGGQVSGST